jgi:hypothetical protein
VLFIPNHPLVFVHMHWLFVCGLVRGVCYSCFDFLVYSHAFVCRPCPDDGFFGVTAGPSEELFCTEGGQSSALTLVLESEPRFPVTIDLVADFSNGKTEGSVAVSSVTFTSSNWGDTQTVAVVCEDDDVVDGDVQFEIVVMPAASDDPNYDGVRAMPSTDLDSVQFSEMRFLVTAIDGV